MRIYITEEYNDQSIRSMKYEFEKIQTPPRDSYISIRLGIDDPGNSTYVKQIYNRIYVPPPPPPPVVKMNKHVFTYNNETSNCWHWTSNDDNICSFYYKFTIENYSYNELTHKQFELGLVLCGQGQLTNFNFSIFVSLWDETREEFTGGWHFMEDRTVNFVSHNFEESQDCDGTYAYACRDGYYDPSTEQDPYDEPALKIQVASDHYEYSLIVRIDLNLESINYWGDIMSIITLYLDDIKFCDGDTSSFDQCTWYDFEDMTISNENNPSRCAASAMDESDPAYCNCKNLQ